MGEFPEHFWYGMVSSAIVYATLGFIGRNGRRRIVEWLKDMRWLVAVRAWKHSKPPIFGERIRPKSRVFENTPNFVLTPKFDRLPKAPRLLLKSVWFILVAFPYIIIFSIQIMLSLTWGWMEYMTSQMKDGDARPETLFRHAEIGRRSVAGGRKGGSSPERLAATADRDNKIRAEAKKMLSTGKEFRDLASIFVTRYSNDSDYPNSQTQYRNILRPLKDELEIK